MRFRDLILTLAGDLGAALVGGYAARSIALTNSHRERPVTSTALRL
jgi:hypothetical protein